MKYNEQFELKTRDCGHDFYCIISDAPNKDDLGDLVRDIHFDLFGGCLPNDWIYDQIHSAFCLFEEEGGDEISLYGLEADPYYLGLYKWFGEPFAFELCSEVFEDGLVDGSNVYTTIATAQLVAKERIYQAVWDFLNK